MLNKKQNELLGAMIGLIRAASKNGKNTNTDKLLLEGVCALRKAGETDALIDAIREEKFTIVPNCRYCAMPCGSTADADMEIVWNAREAVASVKREIFRVILDTEWNAAAEDKLYFLHKGLFVLGEDETPEALQQVLHELQETDIETLLALHDEGVKEGREALPGILERIRR